MVAEKPENQKVKPLVIHLHQDNLNYIRSKASGERSRWVEDAIDIKRFLLEHPAKWAEIKEAMKRGKP